jgi:hypothetical protein
MTQAAKPVPIGTVRIRVKDLRPMVMTASGWREHSQDLKDAVHAVHLYRSHGRFAMLRDAKDPRFIKGALGPGGRPVGARLTVLPNGLKLNAAFSLFAKNLRFHDEDTDAHWDVMLENPSGFTYLYAKNKITLAKKHKTHIVDEFARYFPKLKRNVLKDLRSEGSVHAVALYTMMKTYMRVGNEIYFKAHGHKGLTTLQKMDIRIEGNRVAFNYKAKDGVPIHIRVCLCPKAVCAIKAQESRRFRLLSCLRTPPGRERGQGRHRGILRPRFFPPHHPLLFRRHRSEEVFPVPTDGDPAGGL